MREADPDLLNVPSAEFDTGAQAADWYQVLEGEALRSIITERLEQVTKHGYTLEHDQAHQLQDLIAGAQAYALAASLLLDNMPIDAGAAIFPWPDMFRPTDVRGNLVKAVAMLWAAVDRIDHAPADHSPEEN